MRKIPLHSKEERNPLMKDTKKEKANNNLDLKNDVDGRYGYPTEQSVPGINNPEIGLPAYNPPVPNRAWTAMRKGADIDNLSEKEKRDLYLGNDNYH